MVRHPCAEIEREWGKGWISDIREKEVRMDNAK